MTADRHLILVGKADCPLCQELEAVVARTLEGRALRLEQRDILQDAGLAALYATEIPVLLTDDGREVVRHHATPEGLRERLRALGIL